jgi:hypothetical protein
MMTGVWTGGKTPAIKKAAPITSNPLNSGSRTWSTVRKGVRGMRQTVHTTGARLSAMPLFIVSDYNTVLIGRSMHRCLRLSSAELSSTSPIGKHGPMVMRSSHQSHGMPTEGPQSRNIAWSGSDGRMSGNVLLGPREMSDLSPQSGPKQTLIRSLSRTVTRTMPKLERRIPCYVHN